MIKLLYTGGGYGGARPGVPARDLTEDEVERLGGVDALVATGLYQLPEEKKTEPKSHITYRKSAPQSGKLEEGES